MVENGVRFGVLGTLEMTVRDEVVPLGTPKQRAVLATLLINRNRAVGVAALIEAAWEEAPPPGATPTVHSYVSNLRRLIRKAGVDPRDVLTNSPPGYRLAVTEGLCDVDRFHAKRNAGIQAAAAGRFEQASRHLSAALSEWRGAVLDDLRDFRFVEPFAKPLVEDKVVTHTALAEAEIACGRAYSVIGPLEALVGEHPYREPLWAQLITAYYLTDRQVDALDAYSRLRTKLTDELGLDPSPTLSALHQRILRQERLDCANAATSSAADTLGAFERDHPAEADNATAALRDAAGRVYRLMGSATRIGRSTDNDIVLNDAKVSRHHAVITGTGRTFVITDLGSANGVQVLGQWIKPSATLSEHDHIRIGDQEFTFEAGSQELVDS